MNGVRNLCKWGKKYLFELIVIIGLGAVLQVLFSYLPLFVQYAIKVLDKEINGKDDLSVNLPGFLLDFFNSQNSVTSVLLCVGATLVGLQAIRSVMRFACNYYTGHLTQSMAYDMRIKLFDHIGDLSYTYHNRVDTGDLIQRSTSDIETASSFVSQMFPSLLTIFVTVGMGAYQVYQINPILMWVSLIVVPISAISSVIYFKYCNKAFKTIEEAESRMTTVIQENVNGARIVRAFANEKFEFEKMDKANCDYCHKNQKFLNVMAIYWGSSDFSVTLQYALTISVGVILCKNGLVDTGDIAACLLLMGMLVWPIRGLGRIIASFGKTFVAVNRIQEVLDTPSEFNVNGTLTPEIKGNIEFKDVYFKFDDDNKNLLQGVSFTIKPGQMIAIVGKTGSGKSTICNLLTRMLELNSGDIIIDGTSIKDIEKKYLRTKIRMVLQDPFLYSKTVYENIAITDKKISPDKVYKASEMASLHSEVEGFEKGYKTLVGEKGTTLSGGQKQRVAIARILVENSPVLVFDDSLSALDTKTDLMIRTALKNKPEKQTMIVITHRTTTAKEADQIVVLDEGKIVEIGTHEELANKEGLYKELWGIQGELEKEFNNIMKGEND